MGLGVSPPPLVVGTGGGGREGIERGKGQREGGDRERKGTEGGRG